MAGGEEEEENGFVEESEELSLEPEQELRVKPSASRAKEVEVILKSARAVQAISVDLSGKGLVKIPEELYDMDHVEFLYLEGNILQHIPSELFDSLKYVKWLDLRNNCIRHLPASMGNHRCLKTLLLEGNKISELPPEMGQLKTLTGLNLRGNPIEFPPPKIIEKGAKEILRYLREALAIKGRRLQSAELRIEDLHLSDTASHSSESDNEYDSGGHHHLDTADRLNPQRFQSSSRLSVRSSLSNVSDLEFPRPKSVSLHKHLSYEEYRQLQYDKFKRAGALGVLGKDKRKKKRQKKNRMAPVIDPIQSKLAEERRLAKLAQLKQKQMAIEQRRKDQQLLDDWRQETKDMQRKHYIRAVRNAQQDFVDPELKMPYDTDPSYMRMMNREDRIKEEVKNKHEALKNMITPEAKQRIEQARLERDRQLINKIKDHTQKVHERKQRPKGNPRAEMDQAQKDLAEAQSLQEALHRRHDNVEYRFRAFTGEDIPTPYAGHRSHAK